MKTPTRSGENFQKFNPEFEAHSKVIYDNIGSVFKSPVLRNYQLIKPHQDLAVTIPLPDEIKQLISWSENDIQIPGAYPVDSALARSAVATPR